jgi:hypothetical protein
MDTGSSSVGRLTEQQLLAVLAAADRAVPPCAGRHCDRPWRFHCTPTTIELHAATSPARVLACGAALLNLRLAVQALGVYADVRLAPDPAVPTLLATVRPEHQRPANPWDRRLADGDRSDAPDSADDVLRELRRAAEVEQAWLATLSPARLGLPAADTLVAVVGSLQDDVRAVLRAGQALQRVLLTTAAFGLTTALAKQPLATPASCAELRKLIGGALSPHAVIVVDLNQP